jgi:hypothetical protein
MKTYGVAFTIGLVILFVGASLAVDVVLEVKLPLARIVLALMFIALGAHMVVHARRSAALHHDARVRATRTGHRA